MRRLRYLARRLSAFLRRGALERELAEEMALHRELLAADSGEGVEKRLGNETLAREESRDAWGIGMIDEFGRNLRYGWRTLTASPVFALTAIATLALGIGANTAIFTVLNAVLLRSLPVHDPASLVQVRIGSGGDDELNTPIWEQLREHQTALAGVAAYAAERFDVSENGEIRFVSGNWVSGDYFSVLGVPALLGRTIQADDDQWGASAVAVIGYGFWQREFQGDAGVVGRTMRIDRQKVTIIGVTPEWFTGLDRDRPFDAAVPIGALPVLRPGTQRGEERFHWWLRVVGRLRPEVPAAVTTEKLRATAAAVFAATVMPERSPKDQAAYRQQQLTLSPASAGFSGVRAQYRTALWTLMAMVGMVLLIACANIANLLLARGAARQREISVRMAIGAGRWRIVRQLMTETLLLSLLGAIVGIRVGTWGSGVLTRMLDVVIDVFPDWRVMTFTALATLMTAVLCGLVPALRTTRPGSSAGSRFGKVLVTAQVGLCLLLVIGASLFSGTLRNLLRTDLGFTPAGLTWVRVDLSRTPMSAPARREAQVTLLDAARTTPGVEAAASAQLIPIGPQGWAQPVEAEGFTPTTRRDAVLFLNEVSPGYFRVMETPLLMGREFDESDHAQGPRAIVINQTAARRFFGNANPIGKNIAMGRPAVAHRVVGVVKDTKYNKVDEASKAIGYLAATQRDPDSQAVMLVIRGRTDGLRGTIPRAFPEAALEFRPFETRVSESLAQPRMVAQLGSMFGGLALMLAMIGLHGVMSYSVARRTGEIGIRMALGARAGWIARMVLREASLPVLAGMVIGLAAAMLLGSFVEKLLYGVRPTEPWALATAVILLIACGLAAAYAPARRAARLDPMAALRRE